jgi:hypothetical protein
MTEMLRPFVEIESTWAVPDGTRHPEYTIPNAVLWHVVRSLHLDEPHQLGIDPMCGSGSNVSFINEVGGNCYGIELDRHTYEVAQAAMSQIEPLDPLGWLRGDAPQVVHGDCTEVVLHDSNGTRLPARYIYTSIPFRELLDGTLGEHIVPEFGRMLLPRGSLSFILIDSADEATRDGVTVNPAAATIEYFERSEFRLLDSIAFRVTNPPPGCDDQFTELMFVRQPELDSWRRVDPTPLSGALLLHSSG